MSRSIVGTKKESSNSQPVVFMLIMFLCLLGVVANAYAKDERATMRSHGRGILCTDQFGDRPARTAVQQLEQAAAMAYPPLPLEDTFTLHSYPSSVYKLYIDFNGDTSTILDDDNVTIIPLVCEAWDPDGDGDSFSDAEKLLIQKIWYLVSEDFMPFTIDVTTEDPNPESDPDGIFLGMRAVVDGGNVGVYGGGWAYRGSWPDTDDYIAYTGTWDDDWIYIAQAASHEVGHTLDLLDHGSVSDGGYYMGHGTGATSWGAIMGWDSYGLGIWDDGNYPDARTTNEDIDVEDSLAIIVANPGVSYRPDDHGSTTTSATPITLPITLDLVAEGIIEQNTDVDYFEFVLLDASDIQFSINEDVIIGIGSCNLDVLAKIHNSSGAVLYESNPLWEIWASFDVTLPAGTYYLSIDGTGQVHPDGIPSEGFGYSDYGILGYYSIKAVSSADFSAPAPDPMTWATVPYATSSGSIAMTATTAVDASGVEYYFTCIENPAHNSGWQDSAAYDAAGLPPSAQYTYTVTARDKSEYHNTTAPSVGASAYICSTCGDLDDSGGDVDLADFAKFAGCWSDDPSINTDCTCANLIEFDDHIINIFDLAVFTRLFLESSSDYQPDCSTEVADPYPPSPDPMTFATEPYSTGLTSIAMVATTATDFSGIEYYFTCTAGGGHDSGWQTDTYYEDTGMVSGALYAYTVTARDTSVNQNITSPSAESSAITDPLNVVLSANGGVLDSFTSEYGYDWLAADLTNGLIPEDGWFSEKSPGPQEFIYSFIGGSSATLNEALIYGGLGFGGYYSENVEVWTSADGTSFTQAGGGTLAEANGSIVTVDLGGVTAKKVKLVITSGYNDDFWALSEFVVNGLILDVTSPTPDPMTWETPPAPGGGGGGGAVGISYDPISGDSDISSDNTYTHAIDFGNQPSGGGVATISSVVFANGGTGNFPAIGGSSQTVGTGSSTIPTSHNGDTAADAYLADGGMRDLVHDMIYDDGTAVIELTGLTSGQPYKFRLYHRSWGGTRPQNIGFDTDGVGTDIAGAEDTGVFYQDDATQPDPGFATSTQVYALTYDYTLSPGVTTLTVYINQTGTGTYHLYGLTNQETLGGDSDTSITMTADIATDASGVEYLFECVSGPGNDSGWQDDVEYTDIDLDSGTEYGYTVTARDKSTAANETGASDAAYASTAP